MRVFAPGVEGTGADDCFDVSTLHPEDASKIMVRTDGSLESLNEYRADHSPVTIPFGVLGSAGGVSVQVYRLKHAVRGAWAMWCLSELYSLVAPVTNMRCGRWVQSRWPWWAKGTIKLLAGHHSPSHLRRSSLTTGPSIPIDEVDDKEELSYRIFPKPTVSSCVLLHLLVRFTLPYRRGKLKDPRQQEQVLHIGRHR